MYNNTNNDNSNNNDNNNRSSNHNDNRNSDTNDKEHISNIQAKGEGAVRRRGSAVESPVKDRALGS